MGMKQIWDGENLPPVGCEVLIHLASINKWVPHKVEGNMRLLCDVRPVDWREPD